MSGTSQSQTAKTVDDNDIDEYQCIPTLIDADDLKRFNDAAQRAFHDWIEAGQVQAKARERGDREGEERAKRAAQRNEMIYDQAARSLATQVNAVLAKVQLGFQR